MDPSTPFDTFTLGPHIDDMMPIDDTAAHIGGMGMGAGHIGGMGMSAGHIGGMGMGAGHVGGMGMGGAGHM